MVAIDTTRTLTLPAYKIYSLLCVTQSISSSRWSIDSLLISELLLLDSFSDSGGEGGGFAKRAKPA